MKNPGQQEKPRRIFAPRFLARFDNWLLKNYPDAWSARMHLALYYSLLVYVLLFAVCLLVKDDPRGRSHIGYWNTAAGLLGGIGFITWLVYLFRFNVFKRFGKLAWGDRLRTFFMYFVTIFVFVAIVFIPFVAEKIKADAAFTDDEIVQDASTINLYIGRLERNSLEMQINTDTLIYAYNYEVAKYKNDAHDYPYSGTSHNGEDDYSYADSAEMRQRMIGADSLRPLGDSGYVFTDYSSLRFLDAGNASDFAGTKPASTLQLYYSIYRNPQPGDSVLTRKKLYALIKKYMLKRDENEYGNRGWDYDYINDDYNSGSEHSTIRGRYNLSNVENSFYHIYQRKHRFRPREFPEMALVTLYFTLALCLLVFTFRHSTIRTFFISLLSGIVLGILSGLVIAIFKWRGPEVLIMLLVYYFVFLAVAITIPASRKRSLVKGIALNFSLWMTFTFPLLLVGIYYARLHEKFRYEQIEYAREEYEYVFRNESFHFGLAQGAGLILLSGMILFLFSRLYRTWYAQPEE